MHRSRKVNARPYRPNPLLALSLFCLINALTCLSTVYVDAIDNDNNQTSSDAGLNNLPQSLSLRQADKFVGNLNSVSHQDELELVHKVCQPEGADGLVCSGVIWKDELREASNAYPHIRQLAFVNVENSAESEGIEILDLSQIFPQLSSLSFVKSSGGVKRILASFPRGVPMANNEGKILKAWESLRHLNLSGNSIQGHWIPGSLLTFFPSLVHLDLSQNNISTLGNLDPRDYEQLETMDLSGNPLDCTSNFDWIDGLNLVNADETVCELPPHQNKPKPILKVYPLVKKVREECRLNCSCFVEYIWEQGKGIHSKNAVNCSNKNLSDFPDPDLMPRPTDTLYLNHNKIQSLARFSQDDRYQKLSIMNLFLNGNRIASLNPLEDSDWLHEFQILSLRDNYLTDMPSSFLENVLRQNKRLYFIDISNNRWNCNCHTVMTLKVWLLRYSHYVRNVEDVRCFKTHEQVRHMKLEDWCQTDGEVPIVEILDLVSVTLAFLIVAIICKVYYDYWNYKRNGRLPWLVSKI